MCTSLYSGALNDELIWPFPPLTWWISTLYHISRYRLFSAEVRKPESKGFLPPLPPALPPLFDVPFDISPNYIPQKRPLPSAPPSRWKSSPIFYPKTGLNWLQGSLRFYLTVMVLRLKTFNGLRGMVPLGHAMWSHLHLSQINPLSYYFTEFNTVVILSVDLESVSISLILFSSAFLSAILI
jgi:hypothetical protein